MSDPQAQQREEQQRRELEEAKRVQQEFLAERQRIQREQGEAAARAFEGAATTGYRIGETPTQAMARGRELATEATPEFAKARQQEFLDTRQQIQRELGEVKAREFESSVTQAHRAGLTPRQAIDQARERSGLASPPPAPAPVRLPPEPEVGELMSRGFDPVDAFILGTARRSRAELAREGQEFISQDLRIDEETGEVTGTTTFRGVEPLAPESPFVDRFEDERLNIEFARGQRIGDILVARAAERERTGPMMFFEPDSLREYLTTFGRPAPEATFLPEQAEAIRRAETRATQLAFRRGDLFAPDPTNPFRLERRVEAEPTLDPQRIATREPTGDPIRDAAQAFIDPFVNIGKETASTLQDLFRGREVPRRVTDPQTGEVIRETGQPPELAPDPVGATITAGLEPTGRIVVTPFGIVRIPGEERARQLQQISREVRENPAAAIGAGVAAAALVLTPIGKAPVGRVASVLRPPSRPFPIGGPVIQEAGRPFPLGGPTAIRVSDRPFPIRPRIAEAAPPDFDPFGTGFLRRDISAERVAERQRGLLKEIERIEEGFKDPVGTRFAPKDITTFKPMDTGAPGAPATTTRQGVGTIFQRQETRQVQKATETQADRLQKAMDLDTARPVVTRPTAATRTADPLPRPPTTRTTTRRIVETRRSAIPLGLGGGVGLGLGQLTRRRMRQEERVLSDLSFEPVPPSVTAIQRPRALQRTGLGLSTDLGIATQTRTTPRTVPRQITGQIPRVTTRTTQRTTPIRTPGLTTTTIPTVGRPPLRPPPRRPPRRPPVVPPVPIPGLAPRRERRRRPEDDGFTDIRTRGVRNILFEPLSIDEPNGKPSKRSRRRKGTLDVNL